MRAKYLDWCSARVAERFVKLTPEEIYQLAERSDLGRPPAPAQPLSAQESPPSGPRRATESDEATASSAEPPVEPATSFRAIVERVTEALTAELELPDFEEWASAYRADPARYDEELLGLWREPL